MRQLFIDGTWQESESGNRFDLVNPANGDKIADVPDASISDARRAIAAAANMQASWADMPHQQRASYFLKAANIIESRQKEFIDILVEESGSWVGKAGFESGYVP